MQLGRSGDALAHLEKAAQADPMPRGALVALARAQLDVGRLTDAEVSLQKALAKAAEEQERMKIHYQLGQLYQQQGKAAAAREHLQSFTEIRERLTADEK